MKHMLTFCHVDFVHEPGKHMAVFLVKVIVWAVDICRDHRRELASMLLVVGPGTVTYPLSIRKQPQTMAY